MQLMLLERQNKKRVMMARGGMQLIDIEEAIVQLMLDKGANIEATDNLGKTAPAIGN